MLIGNSLGIVDILFMLALLGFALWKTSWIRVLLSICIIVWGAFAFDYDIKVAAPLMAVGITLFTMGIIKLIRQQRMQEN